MALAKANLVKEIDAMGGAMAAATDEAGIQFRILNSSKGPKVCATRAQGDQVYIKAAIRRRLENQENLTLFQAAVDDRLVQGDEVQGVVTQMGLKFMAKKVVLTAGTFGWQDSCWLQIPCWWSSWRSSGRFFVSQAKRAQTSPGKAEDWYPTPD